MNRGEIRHHVRNRLGEPQDGTWSDEEINGYIQLAANEHALRALSVEKEVAISSLPLVQEYEFPEHYGGLQSIRYHRRGDDSPTPLTPKRKKWILYRGGDRESQGDPWYYYIFDNGFGLWPIPNREAFFKQSFTNYPAEYVQIYDYVRDRHFTNRMTLHLEDDDPDDDDPTNPNEIYIQHVSLYLRTWGVPFPGGIRVGMKPTEYPQYEIFSEPIFTTEVRATPHWFHFTFSEAPIVLMDNFRNWDLTIYTDDVYQSASPQLQGGLGVQVGVRRVGGIATAYFQLHRLRNDIQVDYFQTICAEMTRDTDIPEIAPVYHPTLIEQTLEMCYEKNGYDMALAQKHGNKARADISYAFAQQSLKTYEHMSPMDSNQVNDYVTYDGATGTFRGRIGEI